MHHDDSDEASKEYLEAMLDLEDTKKNWLLHFI